MRLRTLSTVFALSALGLTGIVFAQSAPVVQQEPEATPEIAPEATAEPTSGPVTELEGADWVEVGGLRFLLSGFIANGVAESQVEAVPYSSDMMPAAAYPAHAQIDFVDYLPDDAPELTHNFQMPAVIRVFDIADFAAYDADDGSGYTATLGLLTGIMDGTIRRTADTVMPHLPLVGAAQVLYARERVIEFDGGRGLAYLTAYAQDVYPLTEGRVQLVFQGVTNDGMKYISAIFPLDTSLFPDEIGEDFNFDEFFAGYEAYREETRTNLEALPDDAFAPRLDAIMALLGSIQVIE